LIDWTIIKILSWTESYFKDHSIDSPRLTAEILLGFSLGVRRLDLYLQHDRPLEKNELSQFKSLIKRRIQHEPVAYITGEKGFFDSSFQVREGVLIPRPDTETLVETAIDLLGPIFDSSTDSCTDSCSGSRGCKNVLELGVGSGAIVVSLAKACPNHIYFACDLSRTALDQAIENAEKISKTPIRFFQGSWFDPLKKQEHFDLIVSNPPYIPAKDLEGLALEIKLHEPMLALDGGVDGLDSIREILAKAGNYLLPGGRVLLEMGFDQKDGVESIVKAYPEYESIEFVRDLAGHNRLASVQKQAEKIN
jgi:release factor glutamine methyltransferase